MAGPLALEMVPGEGFLRVRDSEEPLFLESPTTVTGTQDDKSGIISGASFSTPTFEFDTEVQAVGITATAHVTVNITEASPGTTTGAVDPFGNVSLTTAVTVDVNIKVPVGNIDDDCRATPVNLELFSVAPYDPADGGTVTLTDPDFSIPSVPVTPDCGDIVANGVNDLLGGSGHAVTLPLTGSLVVPEACETDSTTTLAVTPDGSAALGAKVTMTATVASADSGVTDPVSGVVEFFDGTKRRGEIAVVPETGTATFETTTLALGDHNLTARYRGDSTYCSSRSLTPTAYTITANPVFEVTLPGSVRIGGDPAVFPVTLENPSVGAPVDARIDITIQRYSATDSSSDALDPDDVVLEREGPSGVWTPVDLEAVPPSPVLPTVRGTIGPADGRSLAPGASLTENLRVSFLSGGSNMFPGPLTVTFDAVDPNAGPDAGPLASTSGQVVIRNATRAATRTIFAAESAPPFVRYGGTLITDVTAEPTVGIITGTYHPMGPLRLLIDGQAVPYWVPRLGPVAEPQLEVPFGSDGNLLNTYITLPANVGIGTHTLTAEFLGDGLFAPSSMSRTFTVHPPIGTPYECLFDDPFFLQKYIVFASAEGRMPATAKPGASIPVEEFDLSVKVGRSLSEYFSIWILLNGGGFQGVDIDFGEHGDGSAVSVTQTAMDVGPWMSPQTSPVDHDLTFDGEEGTVTLPDIPGETVTTAIEGFTLVADNGDLPLLLDCNPVGDPIVVGETVVAGTTVTVEAPTPTRADDEVVVRASVAPSWATGVVEFYSGATLVGIGAIDNGVATIETSLPAGTHSLTARARTGASAPSSTSAPVVLTVLPAHECAAFAEEGNGAVVRLVYMELLGRCPDEAGFDHWVGRLDGGTSPEAFARSIARTSEAVGRVVDDAYQTMLGRAPDPAGRAFWIGRLQASGRYDGLLADLGASGEFWSKAGSTRVGFVTRVYDRLLGRAPDAGGLEYWVGRLEAGASRRALVLSLANQNEPLGRLVAASYEEILGRDPANAERTAGIAFLRSTGDRSGLYADLIGSTEFEDRAQEFPNPED